MPPQRTGPQQAGTAGLTAQAEAGQATRVPPPQIAPGRSGGVPAQRTAPGQITGEPSAPLSPGSRGRLRSILTVLAGTLALLCLGVVGVAYVVYDGATAPDRSAPDVVVSNYLRALFVDRDEAAAALFTCANSSGLAAIRALRDDLGSRERHFSTTFTVSWGSLTRVDRPDSVDVLVDLKLSAVVGGFEQSDLQPWRFDTRQENGWRICAAERVG